MPKSKLYEEFLVRIDAAIVQRSYLESAWYSYAVLEDRLRSLLRESGGEGNSKGTGAPIKMMGPKLKELKSRAKYDRLLRENFEFRNLQQWKEDRNALTHAMADGTLPIAQIDEMAERLAINGANLARMYSAAARRLKRHRAKIPAPPL